VSTWFARSRNGVSYDLFANGGDKERVALSENQILKQLARVRVLETICLNRVDTDAV
jgi:hypothetical protein